jgi:hypothetical protein
MSNKKTKAENTKLITFRLSPKVYAEIVKYRAQFAYLGLKTDAAFFRYATDKLINDENIVNLILRRLNRQKTELQDLSTLTNLQLNLILKLVSLLYSVVPEYSESVEASRMVRYNRFLDQLYRELDSNKFFDSDSDLSKLLSHIPAFMDAIDKPEE